CRAGGDAAVSWDSSPGQSVRDIERANHRERNLSEHLLGPARRRIVTIDALSRADIGRHAQALRRYSVVQGELRAPLLHRGALVRRMVVEKSADSRGAAGNL